MVSYSYTPINVNMLSVKGVSGGPVDFKLFVLLLVHVTTRTELGCHSGLCYTRTLSFLTGFLYIAQIVPALRHSSDANMTSVLCLGCLTSKSNQMRCSGATLF